MDKCKGNINNFCYVCGTFTTKKRRRSLSNEFKNVYIKCYKKKVIESKKFSPNSVCISCYNDLLDWKKGKRAFRRFDAPMIWTNPGRKHNTENCYACKNTVQGMNSKKTKTFKYQSVPSAQLPTISSTDVPVPQQPLQNKPLETTHETTPVFRCDSEEWENHSLYDPGPSRCPILITQDRLDFIVSKLELSQRKSEELAKFLKEQNLLVPEFKVTRYRKRQSGLQRCFTIDDIKTFAYCKDTKMLMEHMKIAYDPDDWRLFIDSSKQSLKAVLLHKTNQKPCVPIAYSTDTKETYEKMELILKVIKYGDHKWRICCDLKVVAMLCGLQGGYTKYMCFLCNWNSRYKGNHYRNHTWEKRGDSKLGEMNVIKKALVPLESVLMPFLHIKLGIVKNFIKAIVRNKENPEHALAVLNLLRNEIFKQKISLDKLKEGVLNGPDIRKLIKDERFGNILLDYEKDAWSSTKEVIAGFLGKKRSQNYEQSVKNMLNAFETIGVHMSLKIHYLHHHLEYFSRQLSTESDEQGERFHQTALPFELRYRGKGSPDAVMAEICWRAKNVFEDTDFEKRTKKMEVDGEEQEAQDHDELSLLEDYEDSDDDDDYAYDYGEEFYVSSDLSD